MYRNYQLQETYVINTHHYLLTVNSASSALVTIHQILVNGDTLPLALDNKHIQACIDESQNQNIINENKLGYEIYFDKNLLQIRMKDNMENISVLQKMEYLPMLEMVNMISLDFAIAVKQIVANQKHSNKQQFNNCSKFYASLLGFNRQDIIVPFVEKEEKKIHYYDIHFGNVFPRQFQGGRKKRGEPKSQPKILSDQQSFRKFVFYLMVILSSNNIAEIMKEIDRIRNNCVGQQDCKEWKTKLKHQNMASLLQKCLARPDEYNIHIFKKECELLIDKYKMKGSEPMQGELHDSQLQREKSKAKEHRPLLVSRQQKTRLSKSFINPSKNSLHLQRPASPIDRSRQGRRESLTRLKYSKSEITLTKSSISSTPKNRKFKKGGISIFKDSKVIPKNNSNFYGQQNFMNSSSSKFGKSNHYFGGVNSTTSNWFNMSNMQTQQLSGKLRNLKKGNNLSNNLSSIQHSRKCSQEHVQVHMQIKKQELSFDEREQRLFAKLKNRVKATLATNNQSFKHEEMKSVKQKAIVQDQFTMTDKQIAEETVSQSVMQQTNKRQITHLYNVSICEDQQQKEKKQNKIISNKQQSKKDIELRKQISSVVQEKKIIQQQSPNNSPKKSLKYKNKQEAIKSKPQSPIVSRKNSAKLIKHEKIAKLGPFAKKGKQNQHKIYEDQLQDISLKQSKNHDLTKSKLETKTLNKTQQNLKSEAHVKKTNALERTNSKNTTSNKKKIGILSEQQKSFQIKHFALFLNFCNENKTHITNLPISSTLTYLINFLYYKTLLENSNTQNKNNYKQLISLIEKKQAKISSQDKNRYMIYRIDSGCLWDKVSALKDTEKDIVNNLQSYISGRETVQCKEELSQFETLTEQGCILLQKLLKDLYTYLQTNKAMLINKNSFSILLQVAFFLSVTLIISLQKQKYYNTLSKLDYASLFNVYTFSFKESESQYLQEYRKKITKKDFTFFSVQEECSNIQNWVQMYK